MYKTTSISVPTNTNLSILLHWLGEQSSYLLLWKALSYLHRMEDRWIYSVSILSFDKMSSFQSVCYFRKRFKVSSFIITCLLCSFSFLYAAGTLHFTTHLYLRFILVKSLRAFYLQLKFLVFFSQGSPLSLQVAEMVVSMHFKSCSACSDSFEESFTMSVFVLYFCFTIAFKYWMSLHISLIVSSTFSSTASEALAHSTLLLFVDLSYCVLGDPLLLIAWDLDIEFLPRNFRPTRLEYHIPCAWFMLFSSILSLGKSPSLSLVSPAYP